MIIDKIHTIDLGYLGHRNGIAAFLIESTEGPILVETGPHSTMPDLLAGMDKLGYAKEDVKHVFLTHIHLDHAGAAWSFAEHGAQIYLHPRGYKHMHDPSKLLASAKMIYKEMMDTLWGTLKPIPAKQLHQVGHQDTITVGEHQLIAHHTPGHAQHHIAWQVAHVVFTGDVAGVCINDGPIVPPCPPPDINREQWLESIDLLLALKEVDRYYLTHFGPVDNVSEHMQQLRRAVNSYIDFMEPYARSGASIKDALPDFRAYVKQYLIDQGLSPTDATAYEAANPSDMSVAGLLRYWHKKLT